MSKLKEAEAFYKELQKTYKSPYFPTAEERAECIVILMRECIHNAHKKQSTINKLKALAVLHGSHKTKLSTLILGEFWEQEVEFGVQARKFKEEL